MPGFQKLVYKNNVFMDNSLSAIQPILLKRDPKHLVELRLANLVTEQYVITELLEFMTEKMVNLRTLGLV